jgi:hypothetical protein
MYFREVIMGILAHFPRRCSLCLDPLKPEEFFTCDECKAEQVKLAELHVFKTINPVVEEEGQWRDYLDLRGTIESLRSGLY